jgi:hypothetical protein
MGLNTKTDWLTDWLTDRQSQCDFDLTPSMSSVTERGEGKGKRRAKWKSVFLRMRYHLAVFPSPYYKVGWGHVIAQPVSRRLPTAAAQVRAQVKSCGICGRQSGTGAGFLLVLRFPLSIFIPPTALHSSSIIRGGHNRPVSGRRAKWTQSQLTARN